MSVAISMCMLHVCMCSNVFGHGHTLYMYMYKTESKTDPPSQFSRRASSVLLFLCVYMCVGLFVLGGWGAGFLSPLSVVSWLVHMYFHIHVYKSQSGRTSQRSLDGCFKLTGQLVWCTTWLVYTHVYTVCTQGEELTVALLDQHSLIPRFPPCPCTSIVTSDLCTPIT